ncbi:MAG: hypothetical protein F4Z82_20315 [Caldilineaceae bacterium SB0668_bin_21]|nr:hypothetical protein [Caldilineaceae bacterium SB0668_bin_21]
MIYSDEEILRRLRLGEDSAWEFKQIEFSGDQTVSPRRHYRPPCRPARRGFSHLQRGDRPDSRGVGAVESDL